MTATTSSQTCISGALFSCPVDRLQKICNVDFSDVQTAYSDGCLKLNCNDLSYNTLFYEFTRFSSVRSLDTSTSHDPYETGEEKRFDEAKNRLKTSAERALKLGYKYCIKKVSQVCYEEIKIEIENIYNEILAFQNYISNYKLPKEEKQSLQSYRESLLSLSYDLIFIYDSEINSLIQQFDEKFENTN